MKLHKISGGNGYTTFGCMWNKGECGKDTAFICKNEKGESVPVQSRITAYWPDGSVKWTAHTADAGKLGSSAELNIAPGEEEKKEAVLSSKIVITRDSDGYTVDNGKMFFSIPKNGDRLVNLVTRAGKPVAYDLRPELILAEPVELSGEEGMLDCHYYGHADEVTFEDEGPLLCTVKYTGTHFSKDGAARIPFVIRMTIALGSEEVSFTHTMIYDGDPERDFLKGLGIVCDVPMSGAVYNRHVKFTVDNGVFHESPVTLISWRPRVPDGLYEAQMRDEKLSLSEEQRETVDMILKDVPIWNTYDFCQDSDSHFSIRKKLFGKHLRFVDALSGERAGGGLAFGSPSGSVSVSIRDFWEKYPSGYTLTGLDTQKASCHIWLWSPSAAPMDFRHYADRGYNQVCYEGYDYKGADPVGIACTNEVRLAFSEELIPHDDKLLEFTGNANETTLFIGTPEFYHEHRAFGYWSLPKYDTDLHKKLENELEEAFRFYENEVEQRKWYGMFNFGDFMHTYDPVRHVWRYDVGGYAWDNTELVPTLWLWFYFIRTGRADVFRLAEKLTRHSSEVDVYHIGKYKGMGSRHNVFHWGCPCKEARIAMAGHHRVFYYLTGDRRMEDIFDELKDNEITFLNRDPLGDFYDKDKMVAPTHARTGPDWSSLCSNWMTEWERTNNTAYRDKIVAGSEDIKNAPLRLISGPDFEFFPETYRLRYIGERATGGTHLQICMGAPSVWLEMADLLEDEDWKHMLAEYGRCYFLTKEERAKETGGITGKREFSLPMMATGIGAYAAKYLNDPVTKERVWKTLLDSQFKGFDPEGFKSRTVLNAGNAEKLREIPNVSTNHVAQFCLNVIMCLEFE